ncbi:MAG: hypothetical protein J6D57_02460 [Mogibacterium sp.]|nr:hypothetical protein [Mogibacterium sp.]MBQ6439209.1 hypothetical protein [Mogibacterium sp.]
MQIEQFVMAYGAEQDRLRAMLPDSFESLRPVLRINAEIRDEKEVYVEFNTPVRAYGKRGWINIDNWDSSKDDISFERTGKTVRIVSPFLTLIYTGVGIEGGCPAEKDNDGCFFLSGSEAFREAEVIANNKEFCDCEFAWHFNEGDAHGVSIGKTLPAFREDVEHEYEKADLTAENAAAIPCRQVLGAYIVRFTR